MRIGIIGGLGPLAGVELQRQIILATPATYDQGHLDVVCYTNPHVADRTTSLVQDGGDAFVQDITHTVRVLECAGAALLLLPCNTAHARLTSIQQTTALPVLDMVGTTVRALRQRYGASVRPLLFATDGTLSAKVYEAHCSDIVWHYPVQQQKVMDCIYAIKAGRVQEASQVFSRLVQEELVSSNATVVVLACTELSVISAALTVPTIDPLKELAHKAVCMVRACSSCVINGV